MSLAPLIHPEIRGVEGKRAEQNRVCAAPGCVSMSQHGHHLWARSYLRGQPTEWVHLPSGLVVSNVIGLCVRHHNEVTGDVGGHKAHIKLAPGNTFLWLEMRDGLFVNKGELFPQPMRAGGEENLESQVTAAHAHVDLAEGERCGSCGYQKPVKRPPGPKRARKTWGCIVPDDDEDGADVLDTHVEQIAAYLGLSTEEGIRSVRYHVVEKALYFVTMNQRLFIEDLGGGDE
jgi:hypothetical protein